MNDFNLPLIKIIGTNAATTGAKERAIMLIDKRDFQPNERFEILNDTEYPGAITQAPLYIQSGQGSQANLMQVFSSHEVPFKSNSFDKDGMFRCAYIEDADQKGIIYMGIVAAFPSNNEVEPYKCPKCCKRKCYCRK